MSNHDHKTTGDEAATAASKTLQDGRTSEDSKMAAASALSQREHGETSEQAAEAASRVLQSDDTGPHSKAAAASALSQKDGQK